MSKILVTGGAGFIGSHVTRLLLESGNQAVILDNLVSGKKERLDPKAEFIKGDIADPIAVKKALNGVDAVIHMAGLIIVPESVKDPVSYCQNNVIGSVSLLNSMKEAGVKKIIFSSSACVYGEPEELPLTENAKIKPDNPYGASKAAIEAFLQAFHANFDFDVTILRYFNPYGPGEMHQPETHAIPNFIKAALVKKPIPLYWKGEQVRDFIYIEDLAQAHLDVLSLGGFNTFNIGTESGNKVKEVFETIFEILGYSVAIKDLGKRPGDVQASYASAQRLKKETPWTPHTSLKQGLENTINFYKNLL